MSRDMAGHVEVTPVVSAKERRLFLTFPWRIYRHDPLWVPPLLPERAKAIDPQRGVFFKRGEAEFFIAWRDGQPVGTVCAANDKAVNAQRGTHDCMIGFFEYIEDEQVFLALLDTARAWAQLHGLNALYGPFNLDYEDGYGVLVEGRDRPPVLLCGHTPPYYQIFMERHGFELARGENLAFEISVQEDTPALRRLAALAERARWRGNILVRPADFSRWEQEGEHVLSLLNISLAHLPDFIPWQRDALMEMLASFRAIADPDLVLFAEAGGKVVGFFPGLPNVNEALIHVDGLRHWWDYARLWWYMRRRPACLSIKSVLVHPDYWGTGVAVLLFDEMVRRVRARGYQWLDLSLTSADNPKTPILAERMGARVYKRYRVYRLCL